jgi:NTP pyrophosphatase (non-canonical NTP hydrolase)
MSTIEGLVRHFHEHFGLPIGDTSRTTNKLRRDLIEQEAGELTEAIDAYDADPTVDNLCKVAHEAADVLFAVVGTNLTLGIDTDTAARQLLTSLLTRQGTDGNGKVVKGSHYVPPEMRPALLAQRCDCHEPHHQRGGPGCAHYFSMGG